MQKRDARLHYVLTCKGGDDIMSRQLRPISSDASPSCGLRGVFIILGFASRKSRLSRMRFQGAGSYGEHDAEDALEVCEEQDKDSSFPGQWH